MIFQGICYPDPMTSLWIISALSAALSLLSSMLADKFLLTRIPLLGSFAGLELSHNPGIAFGLRLPPVLQELLIGVALFVVAWMAVRSARSTYRSTQYTVHSMFAYGLILGGGIANIVDRLPDGLVTDFIQIGTFPVFNVADSCITVGAFLMLAELFLKRKKEE